MDIAKDKEDITHRQNADSDEFNNKCDWILEDISEVLSAANMGIWCIELLEGKEPRMKVDHNMANLLGIEYGVLSPEDTYDVWYSRIKPDELTSVAASVQKMVRGFRDENTYLWIHPVLGERYVRCGGKAKRIEGGFRLQGYHYDVDDLVKREKAQAKELKEALLRAEEADRAKARFIFNLSHDIRTPMNAIHGYISRLSGSLDNKEKALEYLAKINNSEKYLFEIINNVLDIADIENGKVKLNESIFDIRDYSKILEDVFGTQMRKKNISLNIDINVSHNFIIGDKAKAEAIILGCLSNAYKYTPEGGRIEVFVEEQSYSKEGCALFVTAIKDNGIGISKEFLPQIFDLFSREKNTTESKVYGSGLGLPIAKKMVEFIGGHIEVESEVGKGSCFKVYIPYRLATANEIKNKTVNSQIPSITYFKGKRILLAEDNEINAEIAEEILRDEGILVDIAEDGAICCNKLVDSPAGYYDCVLMDIQMPNMDGYEASKAIRDLEDDKKSGIPIIAVSANNSDRDVKKALDSGMNDFISKPIEGSVILEILHNYL